MQDQNSNETQLSSQIPFQIAIGLTTLIILFSILIWVGVLHIPASPYESQNSSANNGFNIVDFGTYVSGIFSTLSFIWLVVNAIQQREDLKLQRKEMMENNEHQKKQADQLEAAATTSLENSKIQKEIYAIEKFHPHLQTIYLSLLLKCHAVRVQPSLTASENTKQIINSQFRSANDGSPVILLFLISNAIPFTSKDPDHSDLFVVISKINSYMTNLYSNLHKIKRITSDEPNSFQLIDAYNYLGDLQNLFIELERFLAWLEPNHASSLRSLCKLEEANECFRLIEAISFQ